MDPVKELFWSAVLNGIIAVPIMAVMMLLATNPDDDAADTRSVRGCAWLGWAATAVMAATVLTLFATL